MSRTNAHRPQPAQRTRWLACGLLLLVAAACSDRGWLAPPTLEPLLVHVDAPWFRDAKRRVVLLRGVDLSALERERDPARTRAPRREDFLWLASLGFNLIRLPIAWASLEPAPHTYDFGFLRDKVDPLLRLSNDHGMQVVLAMHQVRWSSCFDGGSGAPRWTCPDAAARAARELGWGQADTIAEIRASRAQCAFFRTGNGPTGLPLRDHYAGAWRAIARYYEQDKRILGFDLLNEPNPTNCFASLSFVPEALDPTYAQLRDVIRDEGAPQALVYQPSVTRGSALDGAPVGLGANSILAPHLYTQTFGAPDEGGVDPAALAAAYQRAQLMARALGGPLLIGEIGANGPPDGTYRPVTRRFLEQSLDELDRGLVSGAVWAFVPQGEEIPAAGGLGIGNEEDAAVLARPFARRIAGIPVAMHFDSGSGEFTFTFRDDPEAKPPDPSEIFLPAKRVYPDGYDVEVTPGDRFTFDELNQRLLLYRGTATEHTVRITRTSTPPRSAAH